MSKKGVEQTVLRELEVVAALIFSDLEFSKYLDQCSY